MPEYRFKDLAQFVAETAIGDELGVEVESTEMAEDRKQYDIVFNETGKVFGFTIGVNGQLKITDEEGQNYNIDGSNNNINDDDERIRTILTLVFDALGSEIEQVASGGRRRKGSRKNSRKAKNTRSTRKRSSKARKQKYNKK